MMTANEIRQSFLDFFESKQHCVVPSSPVVIPTDPTLLFANAGMNQFKEIFLGTTNPASPRATNTQKCIRVSGKHNDLEEVGRDTYHHTFFEMLGNWSFGDYDKREAIEWSWELLTAVWKLDKNRLWVTVFREDDEAEALWKKHTDIDPTHIRRFDEKDNFWEMGETGPCGPCSEIHYDATENTTGGDLVNADSPEVIEIWNLVFIQYNRKSDGSIEELTSKHIDTGMGFERITAVIQGKKSNYDTDIFMPLLNKIEELSEKKYKGEYAVAMRVIADHIRTLSFAIADGVLPSNDGRGYVLRRLLRRAVRFGRTLGFNQPFLADLFPTLESNMGAMFPELGKNRDAILRTLTAEEQSFLATLGRGIALFEEIAKRTKKVFPGEEAFKLYDTYGFPLDLTALMANEKKLSVDTAEFDRLMNEQRERARSARNTKALNKQMDMISDLVNAGIRTRFTGYEKNEHETLVLEIIEHGTLLLKETPFYAEAGGQLGDHGLIECEHGAFRVSDTQKPSDGIILHHGKMIRGEIKKGDKVRVVIDTDRRAKIRRNHTATHLLNSALRQCVNPSIKQAGSMVASDHLRFDFNHFEAVTPEQLKQIERTVNLWIFENLPVTLEEMALADVHKAGDIQAVFDEKYGEIVRVIDIGEGLSKELCGGTHVSDTGDIGIFRIISEGSIASGVRRIEAVTAHEAFKLIEEEHALAQQLAQQLATPMTKIPARVVKLMRQVKTAEKELKKLQRTVAVQGADTLLKQMDEVNGIPLLAIDLGEMPMDALRSIIESLEQKTESGVIVLGSASNGKACFIASVSKDLVAKGINAGKLVGQIARIAGGGGGGKPNKAQAGGKDSSKVPEAIAKVKELILR